MITLSWQGQRTTTIATTLSCHPQTVRERLVRFNTVRLDGLGDRSGVERKSRLAERERSVVIALARSELPGRMVRRANGELEPGRFDKEAQWGLNGLTSAVQDRGVAIACSQVRRILKKEGVRWRRTHSWATRADPAFAPQERGSSRSTRTHLQA